MEIQIENTCQNCNQDVTNSFCSNCGTPTHLEKINRNYALKEFVNLFGFEKGFLYTIKELLLRPGQTTHNYLTKNRYKYTKPLTFLLAASALYTLVAHYLHVESVLQERMAKNNQNLHGQYVMQWVQDNYGYTNILSGVFIVYFLKKFFKKYNYNFYEIAVHLFFVTGETMIMLLLIPVNTKFFGSIVIEAILSLLTYVYFAWALGQFFEKKISSYIKAFIAYILGLFIFMFIAVVIGIVIELLSKGR